MSAEVAASIDLLTETLVAMFVIWLFVKWLGWIWK